MFYSTFEPYMEKDDFFFYEKSKKSIQNVQDNNCFICYQIQKKDDTKSVKMNCITKYNKKCHCNLFIHISCLDEWFIINKDCPVCRNKITIYESNKKHHINTFLYTIICSLLYITSIIYSYIIYIYIWVVILNLYYLINN
jgi:hypothetical protein